MESLDAVLLVNHAGFTNTGYLLDNDRDPEARLLDVNCRAPLVLTYGLGRKMKTRGRGGIIFIASTVAFAAVPQGANYTASTAYLLLLAESFAHEVRPHGIDVLALCPRFTRAVERCSRHGSGRGVEVRVSEAGQGNHWGTRVIQQVWSLVDAHRAAWSQYFRIQTSYRPESKVELNAEIAGNYRAAAQPVRRLRGPRRVPQLMVGVAQRH